jgi:hypothetical protein
MYGVLFSVVSKLLRTPNIVLRVRYTLFGNIVRSTSTIFDRNGVRSANYCTEYSYLSCQNYCEHQILYYEYVVVSNVL